MNYLVRTILILAALSLAAACKSSPGPDAISVGASTTDCVNCHSLAMGARRQVLGAGGDFGGNSSLASHHITAAPGADPSPAQCLVCHDLASHMSGAVRLRNADTGAVIAYDPATAASLEPFCLSCHDADGATSTFVSGGTPTNPFNDGSFLGGLPPNRFMAGDKIAGYWNGSANIHRSGGLSCAGTGTPNTGCHGSNGRINMHGSTVNGLLTSAMSFSIPLTFDTANPAGVFVYNNYKLCFDCHDSYPAVAKEVVLGYKLGGKYDVAAPYNRAPTPYYTTGIQSLFRDRYIADPLNYPVSWSGVDQPYNDGPWLLSYAPLHNFHLLGDAVPFLSWKYRGDPGQVGRITCTACHNVHGTNGTVRSTYEEFGIVTNTPYAVVGSDSYRKLEPMFNYDDTVFKAYPINCNINCHQMMGNTSYWFSPADE